MGAGGQNMSQHSYDRFGNNGPSGNGPYEPSSLYETHPLPQQGASSGGGLRRSNSARLPRGGQPQMPSGGGGLVNVQGPGAMIPIPLDNRAQGVPINEPHSPMAMTHINENRQQIHENRQMNDSRQIQMSTSLPTYPPSHIESNFRPVDPYTQDLGAQAPDHGTSTGHVVTMAAYRTSPGSGGGGNEPKPIAGRGEIHQIGKNVPITSNVPRGGGGNPGVGVGVGSHGPGVGIGPGPVGVGVGGVVAGPGQYVRSNQGAQPSLGKWTLFLY